MHVSANLPRISAAAVLALAAFASTAKASDREEKAALEKYGVTLDSESDRRDVGRFLIDAEKVLRVDVCRDADDARWRDTFGRSLANFRKLYEGKKKRDDFASPNDRRVFELIAGEATYRNGARTRAWPGVLSASRRTNRVEVVIPKDEAGRSPATSCFHFIGDGLTDGLKQRLKALGEQTDVRPFCDALTELRRLRGYWEKSADDQLAKAGRGESNAAIGPTTFRFLGNVEKYDVATLDRLIRWVDFGRQSTKKECGRAPIGWEDKPE